MLWILIKNRKVFEVTLVGDVTLRSRELRQADDNDDNLLIITGVEDDARTLLDGEVRQVAPIKDT